MPSAHGPARPQAHPPSLQSTSHLKDLPRPQTPCTDDLDPFGPACPSGAGLPYAAGVDNAQVGSLKFQVALGADFFGPREDLTLQFQTRTTPHSPADSSSPSP